MQELDPSHRLKKGEDVAPRSGDKMRRESWDLVSAFLDVKVAGKVHHRGSGERHLVRLPSYPKFEVKRVLRRCYTSCPAFDISARSHARHDVRTPFLILILLVLSQGYTLQQFDQAQEGELSQLNREVAKREEEEHVSRFSSSLIYNLGLVRPELLIFVLDEGFLSL